MGPGDEMIIQGTWMVLVIQLVLFRLLEGRYIDTFVIIVFFFNYSDIKSYTDI